MPGNKTSRKTLKSEAVRISLRHPDWGRKTVWDALETRFGKGINIKPRMVGYWIAPDRNESPEDPFDFKDWEPWSIERGNEHKESDLMALNTICKLLRDRTLYVHEAIWAARLHSDIRELDPFGQFFLVEEYAQREVDAHLQSSSKVITEDLDTLVLFKPWTYGRRRRYRKALVAGVQYPLIEALFVSDDSSNAAYWYAMRASEAMHLPFTYYSGESSDRTDIRGVVKLDGNRGSDQKTSLSDRWLAADWMDVVQEFSDVIAREMEQVDD